MTEPLSFSDILRLWPKTTELARDTRMPKTRIYQWLNRNFVHPQYWPALIVAARTAHGVEITPEQLMAAAVAAAAKRRRCKAARKAAATRRANREQQINPETSAEAA